MRHFVFAAALLSFCSEPIMAVTTAATFSFDAGPPGYVPLPGSTVVITDSCAADKQIPYPTAFPDITSRFSLATFTADGKVSYGPVSVAAKNQQYAASVDYANTDIVPIKMWIKAIENEGFEATRTRPTTGLESYREVSVPVLVGVGLRVTAQFVATEGKAEISGLGAIGASASASKLRGTIMVEAIGASGEALAVSIPLPTKLDQTTVENAILALGAGRASLYKAGEAGTVSVKPRVVGMLSPGTKPALVNVIQAEIATSDVPWTKPCKL